MIKNIHKNRTTANIIGNGEELDASLRLRTGTSLVVQWLRIHFPMQGTRVRSLVRELRSHMLRGN